MISLLFASLLALLAVEYFCRLPFLLHGRMLTAITNKAVRVVTSKKISDHWKEVVLLRYAQDIAKHTAVVALMLCGCAALVVLPAFLLDRLFGLVPSTLESFSSLLGLTSITALSSVYLIIRRHIADIADI